MRTAFFSITLTLAALTCAAAACRQHASRGEAPDAPALTSDVGGQSKDAPGPGKDPFASVPRVTVAELAAALKEGRAVALDVRPAEAFAEEHIRGAVSIPEDEVLERAGELPEGKLIVAYCA